jgi:hypothetical protein
LASVVFSVPLFDDDMYDNKVMNGVNGLNKNEIFDGDNSDDDVDYGDGHNISASANHVHAEHCFGGGCFNHHHRSGGSSSCHDKHGEDSSSGRFSTDSGSSSGSSNRYRSSSSGGGNSGGGNSGERRRRCDSSGAWSSDSSGGDGSDNGDMCDPAEVGKERHQALVVRYERN